MQPAMIAVDEWARLNNVDVFIGGDMNGYGLFMVCRVMVHTIVCIVYLHRIGEYHLNLKASQRRQEHISDIRTI